MNVNSVAELFDGKLGIGALSFVSLLIGVLIIIGPLRRIDDPSKWKNVDPDAHFGQLGTDPFQAWAGIVFMLGGAFFVTFVLEMFVGYVTGKGT